MAPARFAAVADTEFDITAAQDGPGGRSSKGQQTWHSSLYETSRESSRREPACAVPHPENAGGNANVRCAPGIYRPAARGASYNKCPSELAAPRSVLPARFPAPAPWRQPGPWPGGSVLAAVQADEHQSVINLVTVTSERGVSGPAGVPLAARALPRAVRSRSQEAGTRWGHAEADGCGFGAATAAPKPHPRGHRAASAGVTALPLRDPRALVGRGPLTVLMLPLSSGAGLLPVQ